MKMHTVRISLNLSQQEILAYYKGDAQFVIAKAHDGRMIRFPAASLRHLVSADGVRGDYEIEYDQNGKLNRIRKIML